MFLDGLNFKDSSTWTNMSSFLKSIFSLKLKKIQKILQNYFFSFVLIISTTYFHIFIKSYKYINNFIRNINFL